MQPAQDQAFFSRLWERIFKFGLGDTALHIATSLFTLVLMAVVIFVMSGFYTSSQGRAASDRYWSLMQPASSGICNSANILLSK